MRKEAIKKRLLSIIKIVNKWGEHGSEINKEAPWFRVPKKREALLKIVELRSLLHFVAANSKCRS